MLVKSDGALVRRGNTKTNLWRGVWALADPKISLASMAALFLGTSAAAAVGELHWGWLAVILLGIYAVEVARGAGGSAPLDPTTRRHGLRILWSGTSPPLNQTGCGSPISHS
ncbi:MAG: hypothetical protein V3S32_09115 [Acidimicrobiia bacterium]